MCFSESADHFNADCQVSQPKMLEMTKGGESFSVSEQETQALAPSKIFDSSLATALKSSTEEFSVSEAAMQKALELMLDPIHGSKAHGKTVEGIVTIHVDDCLLTGTDYFKKTVVEHLRKDFKVGSEDLNDVEFVGQRCRWIDKGKPTSYIKVDLSLIHI